MEIVESVDEPIGFVSRSVNKKEKQREEDQRKLDALLKEEAGEEENAEEENSEETGDEKEPKDSEERTWKQRYGDLRRHSQTKENEFKDTISTLENRISSLEQNSEPAPIPEDEIELQKWTEENPDAAKLINMMASKIADERYANMADELESLKVGQEAVDRDKGVARIMKAHPDFEDLQDDDDFHIWVEDQPKLVQDSVYVSSDPESTIWAIDRYKETLKPKKVAKKPSAAEAVVSKNKAAPSENNSNIIKESDVAMMDSKTYKKNAAKIEEAIANGNFEYDVSGAAR